MRLADVGNTPFVELEGLLSHGNRLFVKCEYLNSLGSHKDRAYLHMITALEKTGVIRSGVMLVDCSTGNGGAALAWIGREKGYHVKVFMPEGMTEERKQQIRSYGADIVETLKEFFLMGRSGPLKTMSVGVLIKTFSFWISLIRCSINSLGIPVVKKYARI